MDGGHIMRFLRDADRPAIEAVCAMALLELVYICGTRPEVLKELARRAREHTDDGFTAEMMHRTVLALVQAELVDVIDAVRSEHPNG